MLRGEAAQHPHRRAFQFCCQRERQELQSNTLRGPWRGKINGSVFGVCFVRSPSLHNLSPSNFASPPSCEAKDVFPLRIQKGRAYTVTGKPHVAATKSTRAFPLCSSRAGGEHQGEAHGEASQSDSVELIAAVLPLIIHKNT